MRAEKDHTSGYLYCSDTPAGPETAAALDACGHFEASGAGVTFVAAFAVCSAIYLGGGAAHRVDVRGEDRAGCVAAEVGHRGGIGTGPARLCRAAASGFREIRQ